MPDYPRIASLRTPEAFATRLQELGLDLGFDAEMETGSAAPLAQPATLKDGTTIGNRFCVLAMEGWDGTPDGHPTELTVRRWHNFGLSGSKLIWGGEATAVQPDGRANPNQLMIDEATVDDLAALRRTLVDAHRSQFATVDDLLVGLQLTHSGRFCRPNEKARTEPRILYHHPMLDAKFGVAPDYPVITDDYIHRLIDRFVAAAKLAQRAGFAFVDVKHCHGYLGPRVPHGQDTAGALRRKLREPHALPARDRGGHPGRGAGAGHRRPPERLRLCALQSGQRWRRHPDAVRGRDLRLRLRWRWDGRGAGHDRALRLRRPAGGAGHRAGLRDRGQPLLHSRTSSVRRSSRPPTATSRRRTRSSAWPARCG